MYSTCDTLSKGARHDKRVSDRDIRNRRLYINDTKNYLLCEDTRVQFIECVGLKLPGSFLWTKMVLPFSPRGGARQMYELSITIHATSYLPT